MQFLTKHISYLYDKIERFIINLQIHETSVILNNLCFAGDSSVRAAKNYLDHLSDYIENTSVFEENQEAGHAYFVPAKHLSLNGRGAFSFAMRPPRYQRISSEPVSTMGNGTASKCLRTGR